MATLKDVAKAVWEYPLNDKATSTPELPSNSTAGNQLRYARVDSYRPTPKFLAAIVDAIKALLP